MDRIPDGFKANIIWRIYHSSAREILKVRDVVLKKDHLNKFDEKNPRKPI